MNDPRTLHITLQPNGVSAPAHRAVIVATRVVNTFLPGLKSCDLNLPTMREGGWAYNFGDLKLSEGEWRNTLENWVLSKAFQDLTRGIRATLEEAVLYQSMAKMKPRLTTWAKVSAEVKLIRNRAAGYSFPKLLEEVNSGLKEPMAFEEQFRSLQKARNCLEHREGIVGEADVDASTGKLNLTFPRLKAFYHRRGEEVEIAFGEVIDTQDADSPPGHDHGVELMMRRVDRTVTFTLGEPITITPPYFDEIAMACFMFASDIAEKLRSPSPNELPDTERH